MGKRSLSVLCVNRRGFMGSVHRKSEVTSHPGSVFAGSSQMCVRLINFSGFNWFILVDSFSPRLSLCLRVFTCQDSVLVLCKSSLLLLLCGGGGRVYLGTGGVPEDMKIRAGCWMRGPAARRLRVRTGIKPQRHHQRARWHLHFLYNQSCHVVEVMSFRVKVSRSRPHSSSTNHKQASAAGFTTFSWPQTAN